MRTVQPKRIGLAIVGAGRVGLMRGEIAARFPQVDWIGIAEIDPERANLVAGKLGADFVTTDYRALLRRPEVTAALISTVDSPRCFISSATARVSPRCTFKFSSKG